MWRRWPHLSNSASAAALILGTPKLAFTTHQGDGPPVLFIHGMLAAQVFWQWNLPAMRTVSTPVTIDLWGHDRSPSPPDETAYHPSTGFVDAFEAVREQHNVDRWMVVSHSLGTALAMHYALAKPHRVAGLVITNSRSGFALQDRAELDAETERTVKAIGKRGMAAFDRSPIHPARSRRLAPDVKSTLAEAVERHDPFGLSQLLRHTLPLSSSAYRLAELKTPTLLAWGIYEKAFDAGAKLAIERIPDLRVARLQAGHAVNLGDRDGFDNAVTGFISEMDNNK